jgi:hypothetical protein
LGSVAGTWDKWTEARSEFTSRGDVPELQDLWPGVWGNSPGEKGDVGRHRGLLIHGAGNPAVERTQVGIEGVFACYAFQVVYAVTGDEGAYDAELVREPSEFGEGAAESDAWCGCWDFTGHTPDFGGSIHFGIKGFKLRRASVHEEKNHRLVPRN